ncbi:MAG: CapA family protein [Oscillospiraceae bacterium]|nr:CapA family protein [Oscillospiraceae bacterium]
MKDKLRKLYRNPFLRLGVSLLALALIIVLGINAVKFCMGLFLTGDYFVSFPGAESPVVHQAMEPVAVTEPPQTEPPAPGMVTEVSRASFAVGGDIMMHMPTVRSGKVDGGYNYDYIFSYLSNYVSTVDYAAANLETTLSGTDNGNKYTGFPQFNSPDAIADGAKNAGFDLLTTANNHCNDYGTFGLKRTLDILKNRGLDTLGTTGTAEEARYVVKEVDGIQVGMVSYTYGEIGDDVTTPSVNGLPLRSNAAGLLNAFDYRKLDLFYSQMEKHIADMKEDGAEAIVLFIHWGDEYKTSVNSNQTAMAQKLCDLGVDVIAGSHPHVVQTVDILTSTVDPGHQTVCVYSMGNLLSNQRANNVALDTGHTEDGLLFLFSFAKYSDGSVHVVDANVLPTWVLIRGSGDSRKYYILPLDENLSDWKAVFELNAEQLTDAQSSYSRTEEIVKSGREKVRTAISETCAAREAAWMAEAGITEPVPTE